eukprot:s9476_g2.t1
MVARMLWLHAVSQVGREINGGPSTRNRDVLLQYPEGVTPEFRGAQEAKIKVDEDTTRAPDGEGGPATWEQTLWLWEHVQGPRLAKQYGGSTMDARFTFWDTRLWKEYQRLNGLRMVSFDQGAMGGSSVNATTLGTNVNNLMSLNDLRVPDNCDLPLRGDLDHVWATGLVEALVVALSFWERDPRCAPRCPRVQAFTPEQWREHVNSNHAVYRRDCETCVMARGTGRQHRRVHHPQAFVLTADVAGPIAPGLDPTSKGTTGKHIKYLLVMKYVVPKSYVELYSGHVPPSDDGMTGPGDKGDGKLHGEDELFKELFNSEDNAEAEEEDQHFSVEVTYVPDGKDLELLDDFEEELDYEPSEVGNSDEPGGDGAHPSQNTVMIDGDCQPPEMTCLMFSVGLTNNQAVTVKRGLQDVVLYLQLHGFPVFRFHADKENSTTINFEGGFEIKGYLVRGQSQEYLKAMVMQNHL